jgi:hypothetical protein
MRILTILGFLFSVSIMAQEVPGYLKDGVITVTLKDGKTYTYSTNEYMVVKRGAKKEIPSITFVYSIQESPVVVLQEQKRKKHIVSGMLGFSRHDLDSSVSGTRVSTKNDHDFDFGVQYQYEVSPDIYLNVLGTVNETGLVGIGFGF